MAGGERDSSTDDSKEKTPLVAGDADATAVEPTASVNRKPAEGLSGWISKSNVKQQSDAAGRRQSLDILLDAGDRVKDVFANSFQRVGRTLERRNSESEVSGGVGAADPTGAAGGRSSAAGGASPRAETATSSSMGGDFFSFGVGRSAANDLLTDEQVENLLLSEDCAQMLRNVLNISK